MTRRKAETALYGSKEASGRARVRVHEVVARSALSPSRLAGYAYTLNPYRGCAFGCAYCYSPSVLRMDRSLWAREIGVKRNLPAVLAKELKRLEPPQEATGGWVAISTVTDGYQPVEARYKVTRHCLAQLVRYDWPVSLLTKSHLFERDLDLLTRLSRAEVGLSLTTPDFTLQHKVEPGVAPMERRLKALERAAEAGLRVYCFLGPLYPTTSAQAVEELVAQVAAAGVREVMVDDLHLHPGVWTELEARLGPDLAREWWGPLHDGGQAYRSLFAAVERACRHAGLGFRLSELAQSKKGP